MRIIKLTYIIPLGMKIWIVEKLPLGIKRSKTVFNNFLSNTEIYGSRQRNVRYKKLNVIRKRGKQSSSKLQASLELERTWPIVSVQLWQAYMNASCLTDTICQNASISPKLIWPSSSSVMVFSNEIKKIGRSGWVILLLA